MPDYSLSAMLASIGTGGLLSLVLVAIGISFVYVSLDTKTGQYKNKTKIMSPGLFWIGIALFVSGCGAVVMV